MHGLYDGHTRAQRKRRDERLHAVRAGAARLPYEGDLAPDRESRPRGHVDRHDLDLGAWAWKPFVDQRMVFPKLSIVALARWTGNRQGVLELIGGLAAQAVVALLLFRLVRDLARGDDDRRDAQAWIVLLLFWPLLLFRFQNPWYSMPSRPVKITSATTWTRFAFSVTRSSTTSSSGSS